MHQPEIVFDTLLEADEQFAKAVMPRPGALDHPAPGWMALPLGNRLPAPPDVGRIPPRQGGCLNLGVVISFVQTQMLGCGRTGTRPLHDYRIQRLAGRPHVVAVGRSNDYRQRGTALVGQRVALGTEFAAIRGIGAGLRPPKGALTMTLSSACHRHWMPWRSS